jgi:hypothetical protein
VQIEEDGDCETPDCGPRVSHGSGS